MHSATTTAFTVEETRTVLTAARRHGLGLRIHASSFARHRSGVGRRVGAATADHLETSDRKRHCANFAHRECNLFFCQDLFLVSTVRSTARPQHG